MCAAIGTSSNRCDTVYDFGKVVGSGQFATVRGRRLRRGTGYLSLEFWSRLASRRSQSRGSLESVTIIESSISIKWAFQKHAPWSSIGLESTEHEALVGRRSFWPRSAVPAKRCEFRVRWILKVDSVEFWTTVVRLVSCAKTISRALYRLAR